jgi:predicted esterase
LPEAGAGVGGSAPALEHHLETVRTARYYALGNPSPDTSEVWFVLHGFGQLAGYFIRSFSVLGDGRRYVVAPEALSRYYLGEVDGRTGRDSRVGATWMTREDRLTEISDYVRYLDTLYAEVFRRADRSRCRTVVLGFSQGAETACRWVCRGTASLDRFILWAGKLAPELETHADFEPLRRIRLDVVLGRDDPFGDAEMLSAMEGKLRRHDVPFEVVRFDGGHEIHAPTLAALAR